MILRRVRVRRPAPPIRRRSAVVSAALLRELRLLRLACQDAPPRRLARALLEWIEAVLPGSPCEVLIGDPQAGYLQVVGTRGFRAERGLGCRIPIGVGVTGAAARQARTVWVPDVANDTRYIPGVPGARWELAVPLCVGRRVIGVIDLEGGRAPCPSLRQRLRLARLAAVLAPAFARSLPATPLQPLRLQALPGRGQAPRPAPEPMELRRLLIEHRLSVRLEPLGTLDAERRVIGHEAEVLASGGVLTTEGGDPATAAATDLVRLEAALGAWRVGMGVLFCDVHAAALRRPGFLSAAAALARRFGLAPTSLVLELNDVHGLADVLRRADHGSGGVLLAMDHFGVSGGSQALVELQPAYIKLAASLIRGVERDFGRRTYIESLCYYTRRTGAHAVALGVATPGERAALRQCGVTLGQGTAIGPPQRDV